MRIINVLTVLAVVCLAVSVFFMFIYPQGMSLIEVMSGLSDESLECSLIFFLTAGCLWIVRKELKEKEVLSDKPEDELSPVVGVICFVIALAIVACYWLVILNAEVLMTLPKLAMVILGGVLTVLPAFFCGKKLWRTYQKEGLNS